MRTLLALLLAMPGAALAQPAPATNCTDVEVGTAKSYDCINAQLANMAHATQRPSSMDAPVTATSPSNQVGTFNEGALRNRLGANFGKSVQVPQPPAYAPAFAPRPH